MDAECTSTDQKMELKNCSPDDTNRTRVKLELGEYKITSRCSNENIEEMELAEREATFGEPRIEFSFRCDTRSEGSDSSLEEHKIAIPPLTRGDEESSENKEPTIKLTDSTGAAEAIEPRIEMDYEDTESDVEEQKILNRFFSGNDANLSHGNEPTCELTDTTFELYDAILNNAELVVNDLYDEAHKNPGNGDAPENTGENRVAGELCVTGIHACRTCGTMFTRRAYYLKHIRLHRAESSRSKRRHPSNDQAFESHVDTSGAEKSSECSVCDYNCSEAGGLKRHMRTHTGEKPFKCTICDYRCSQTGNLKAHVHTHTGEKPFECSVCDYRCSSAARLKRHVRTHTGEKPFECTVCDYKCAHMESLKIHVHSHTGEKPFECTVCDYRSSRAGHLKIHVRTHTGEKPFECTVCDYKCSRAELLRCHIRTHTGEKPFECTICDYKCSRAGDLKRHGRTHTGEKPFKCTACDYKSSQAGYLKKHMRTHTGEKPFECTMCEYKCRSSRQLKRHTNQHEDRISSK